MLPEIAPGLFKINFLARNFQGSFEAHAREEFQSSPQYTPVNPVLRFANSWENCIAFADTQI